LVGTTCNRDAIGARAELEVTADGTSTQRIVRSVRAGDGFLSQSSKRLHFGVKRGAEVQRLIVRWPGGDRETFSGLSVGASFEIRQGTGHAIRLEARKAVRLDATPYEPLPPTAAARIVLPGKVAFPPIDCKPDARSNPVPLRVGESATLLVFWTSSCPNCRRELSDIADHGATFRDAGLNVVAICLDGLDQPEGTPTDDDDDATTFLQSINFPFLAVHATGNAIERVRLVQNALFAQYPDFVVPLSFLVDSAGQIVCIYRGAFSHQTLLDDRALVDQDDATLRTLAPPLAGTWITQPATRTQIASFIAGRTVATDPVLALRYYEWAIEGEQDANRTRMLQNQIEQLKLITGGRK
jgi:peroxiredoxin